MRLSNLLLSVGLFFGILILQSCSDNGPDYGKMKASRMDIVGAKAVGFIDGDDNSRGEAISSGLYKIDANGNISAVAVYFTEDEDGNQTKHEAEVRMRHADIANAGDDFLFFDGCRYEDKNGEDIGGLPGKILVRKSDGKMWNLDEDVTGVDIFADETWQFYQDNNGTLYWGDGYEDYHRYYIGNIYKFNLKTEPATIEQVTANIEILAPYAVDSKEIICGPVNKELSYSSRNAVFAWQNSGFQKVEWNFDDFPFIRDYSDIVEGLKYDRSPNIRSYIVNFRGQFYSICSADGGFVSQSYPFIELAICNKISIGTTPGSAAIDASETINIKNEIRSSNGYIMLSVVATPQYILTSGYAAGYWITVLNPETKEWKWVTETPEMIYFDNSINYDNRYWVITTIDGNKGGWWFHPGSLETGFVKFSEEIPSYMDQSKYEFVDGKVIYSGVNPADSHRVKIAFDLMTGNAITNDNAPEYKFSTLISLN